MDNKIEYEPSEPIEEMSDDAILEEVAEVVAESMQIEPDKEPVDTSPLNATSPAPGLPRFGAVRLGCQSLRKSGSHWVIS